MPSITPLRTLPWGEEIYMEIPLHKKSANKFYARHGKNEEGKEYVEFVKYGPKPNTENETYLQKLRLYSVGQWAQIKHYVESELSGSIGWDTEASDRELEANLASAKAQNS